MATKRLSQAGAKPPRSAYTQALPLTASRKELLVDGSDQTLRRMTLGFAVLSWLLADIRAGFAKLLNISPLQYVALQAIARVQSDEPWTTQSLARHFQVTNPYVSVELRGLLKNDLLAAQPSSSDRRTKYLVITPAGAEMLAWLAPIQRVRSATLKNVHRRGAKRAALCASATTQKRWSPEKLEIQSITSCALLPLRT